MTQRLSTQDAFCTSGNSPTKCNSKQTHGLEPISGPPAIQVYGPKNAPVILVLGGISASADLNWWPEIVGTHLPIDTSQFRIIGIGWAHTPQGTTTEHAHWLEGALSELHIDHVHTVIGCSYGGMVALVLAALNPNLIDQLVILGAAHRAHPLATAWRWLQRQIAQLGTGKEGLALARALAMTTYRSDREFDQRFGGKHHELIDWLEHHGQQFCNRFDVERFDTLSAAIDSHYIEPETISCPTSIIGFEGDLLVPEWLLDELEARLPIVSRYHIRTIYGHDAFLKEVNTLGPILESILKGRVEVAA